MFVQHFNGKQLLLNIRLITTDMLHFHTDAAGAIGFGAMFVKKWFYGKWSGSITHLNITFKGHSIRDMGATFSK